MQKLNSITPHNLPPKSIKSLFSFFSSLQKRQIEGPPFLNYLIETLNIPEQKAVAISNKYYYTKSPENSQSVVQFLQNIGFSESHIRSSVTVCPQILVSDIDKILKPKIEYFQRLGIFGSDLGKFISKNSTILTYSLEKRLIPCVEILKQILVNDKDNEDLIRVLGRWYLVICKNPKSRLLINIEYLKSCGIVGSQLSMLLKRQPSLFIMQESKLRGLVSRALDMGFSINSRMFVHGLLLISYVSEETFEKKMEFFRTYGFTRDEFIGMFRRAPNLIGFSEKKMKLRLEFFLKKAECKKAVLFQRPECLMYSLENRVIPRYRVLQIVTSGKLMKKGCDIHQVLDLSEGKFLDRFVLKFGDNVEELLLAYKGQTLSSSSSSFSASSSSEEEC